MRSRCCLSAFILILKRMRSPCCVCSPAIWGGGQTAGWPHTPSSFTTHPTWRDLGLNPGRRCRKPATGSFSSSTLFGLWNYLQLVNLHLLQRSGVSHVDNVCTPLLHRRMYCSVHRWDKLLCFICWTRLMRRSRNWQPASRLPSAPESIVRVQNGGHALV
jgi:hypothetical protein